LPEHPSFHELAALVANGRLNGRAERSWIVRHLAGCEICLTRIRTIARGRQRESPQRFASSLPAVEFDYGGAFEAAEHRLSLFLDRGEPVLTPPGELLAELGLPETSCTTSAASHANRMAIPFLTHWLIEKSHSLRFTDPEEMLHWALMARVAAQGCSREAARNERRLADLQAEAEAQLSNALRVLGRIAEAEDCIQGAWRLLEHGTGDAEIRATVFGKTTSLLILKKDFQLATDLALEVSKIYTDLGSRHRAATARIGGAIATLYDGDPERAVRELWQALPWINPEEDPTLLLATRINLVRCYIDLGEPAKALATRQQLPSLRGNLEPMILLRMDWQEGLLLHSLGEQTAAARMLNRVRRGYIERRLAREAIVVTHDLAKALGEAGEAERAAGLLNETAEWIQRGSFGPEVTSFYSELRDASP
jgi:tetratricopeptide (TPR) repeat protein